MKSRYNKYASIAAHFANKVTVENIELKEIIRFNRLPSYPECTRVYAISQKYVSRGNPLSPTNISWKYFIFIVQEFLFHLLLYVFLTYFISLI